jgi:hypothetical protein
MAARRSATTSNVWDWVAVLVGLGRGEQPWELRAHVAIDQRFRRALRVRSLGAGGRWCWPGQPVALPRSDVPRFWPNSSLVSVVPAPTMRPCKDSPVAEADGQPADVEQEPSVAGLPTSNAISPLAASTHWTPQRLRVRQWLEVEAPNLAPVYEACVLMAVDPTFPGRVWFIAHALRDIRNRLPEAIAGPVEQSRTEYSELARKVTKCWMDEGLPGDGSSPFASSSEPRPGGPPRLNVSQALIEAVGDLVAGDLAIPGRKKDAASRLFAALAGGPVPSYVIDGWLKATGRAEPFAHLRNEPLTTAQVAEFDQIFYECESALIAIASRSYENMDALDEILESANR